MAAILIFLILLALLFVLVFVWSFFVRSRKSKMHSVPVLHRQPVKISHRNAKYKKPKVRKTFVSSHEKKEKENNSNGLVSTIPNGKVENSSSQAINEIKHRKTSIQDNSLVNIPIYPPTVRRTKSPEVTPILANTRKVKQIEKQDQNKGTTKVVHTNSNIPERKLKKRSRSSFGIDEPPTKKVRRKEVPKKELEKQKKRKRPFQSKSKQPTKKIKRASSDISERIENIKEKWTKGVENLDTILEDSPENMNSFIARISPGAAISTERKTPSRIKGRSRSVKPSTIDYSINNDMEEKKNRMKALLTYKEIDSTSVLTSNDKIKETGNLSSFEQKTSGEQNNGTTLFSDQTKGNPGLARNEENKQSSKDLASSISFGVKDQQKENSSNLDTQNQISLGTGFSLGTKKEDPSVKKTQSGAQQSTNVEFGNGTNGISFGTDAKNQTSTQQQNSVIPQSLKSGTGISFGAGNTTGSNQSSLNPSGGIANNQSGSQNPISFGVTANAQGNQGNNETTSFPGLKHFPCKKHFVISEFNLPPVPEGTPSHNLVLIGLVAIQNKVTKKWCATHETRGWYMPAGRIDYGEGIETGAKREALEEAGVQVTLNHIVRIDFSPNSKNSRFRAIFEASLLDDQQKLRDESLADDEIIKAEWVNPEELEDGRPVRTLEMMEIFQHLDRNRNTPKVPANFIQSLDGKPIDHNRVVTPTYFSISLVVVNETMDFAFVQIESEEDNEVTFIHDFMKKPTTFSKFAASNKVLCNAASARIVGFSKLRYITPHEDMEERKAGHMNLVILAQVGNLKPKNNVRKVPIAELLNKTWKLNEEEFSILKEIVDEHKIYSPQIIDFEGMPLVPLSNVEVTTTNKNCTLS